MKILHLLFTIFLSLVIVIFVAFADFVLQIPTDNQDLVKTEAIVVFTGGKKRVTSAVALFKKDLATYLYISGVSKNATKKQVLSGMDIKDDSKIFLGTAQNTEENAKEVIEWAKNNKVTSIRLVTTNYHMPRSLWEMKKSDLGGDLKIVPHVLPVYGALPSKTLYDFVSEFVKLQLLKMGFTYADKQNLYNF